MLSIRAIGIQPSIAHHKPDDRISAKHTHTQTTCTAHLLRFALISSLMVVNALAKTNVYVPKIIAAQQWYKTLILLNTIARVAVIFANFQKNRVSSNGIFIEDTRITNRLLMIMSRARWAAHINCFYTNHNYLIVLRLRARSKTTPINQSKQCKASVEFNR